MRAQIGASRPQPWMPQPPGVCTGSAPSPTLGGPFVCVGLGSGLAALFCTHCTPGRGQPWGRPPSHPRGRSRGCPPLALGWQLSPNPQARQPGTLQMDCCFLIAHVLLFSKFLFIYLGLPRCRCGKEPVCPRRRCRFSSWVAKIPWRRKWQPTPVFLPGESHGQRSLVGHSPLRSQT